jgi:N-acetyltransferase
MVQLDDILGMVDTVLSSPALSLPILERCKIFLLVTSSPPPVKKRSKPTPGGKPKQPVERVVGVVVAQPIKVALRVLREGESGTSPIDSGGGVMCE